MYVKMGNQIEQLIMNEIKRIYPTSTIENRKTRGIDITMKLWSRKLNIEVKSCQLRTPMNKNHTKYRFSKFIIYSHNFDDNDIFIFYIRDIDFMRIFPISYLKMIFQDKINKNIDKRIFSITINQILELEYFTIDYILKHYCNESSCSFDCLLCPFTNKDSVNQLIKYLDREN